MKCWEVMLERDPRVLLRVAQTSEALREILPEDKLEELWSIELPSRRAPEDKLRRLVDEAYETSIMSIREGKAYPSVIAFVIGEWGQGKSRYSRLLSRLADERGLKPVELTMEQVYEYLRPYAESENTSSLVRRLEAFLKSRGTPSLVVIDEGESAIPGFREEDPIDKRVLEAFYELLKGLYYPELPAGRGLKGLVHIVMLATPAAKRRIDERLRTAGVAGKYNRRFVEVRLEPLYKHELIELLDKYSKLVLGVELRELFTDPRLIEVIHILSGGNPGVALQLLSYIISNNTCQGRDHCLCKISPERLLLGLMESSLTTSEGYNIIPVDQEEAGRIRLRLRDCPQLLLAVTGATALSLEEVGECSLDTTGYHFVRAEAYRLRDPSILLSRLRERICAGESPCEVALREFLSYILHLTGSGEWMITLPTIDEWRRILDSTGLSSWITYERARDNILEIVTDMESQAIQVIIPSLTLLRRIYRIKAAGLLDYVVDESLRAKVFEQLRTMETVREAYKPRITRALQSILENSIVPGVEVIEGEGPSYTYMIGGIVYSIPVRVTGSGLEKGIEGPVEECLENPYYQSMITLAPIPGDLTSSPVTECPGLILLPIPEGLKRELLAASLVLEEMESSDQIDEAEYYSRLSMIAESLNISNEMENASQRLLKSNIMINPYTPSTSELSRIMGVKRDPQRVIGFMGDIHKFLIAAGGGDYYIEPGRVSKLIQSLVKLAPFGQPTGYKRYWCGVPIPRISPHYDLKEKNPEEIDNLVREALRALYDEGIIEREKAADTYTYKAKTIGDSITQRLLSLRNMKDIQLDEETLSKLFILPRETPLRDQALSRIILRLRSLEHLGLATQDKRKWRIKTQATMKTRPKQLPVSKLQAELRELRDYAEDMKNTIHARTHRNVGAWIGTITYCRQKTCKSITFHDLEATIQLLWMIYPKGKKSLYPVQDAIITDLYNMIKGYIKLSTQALKGLNEIITEIDNLKNKMQELRIRILVDLEELKGLRKEAVDRVKTIITGYGENKIQEVYQAIANSLDRADNLVVESGKLRGSRVITHLFFERRECIGAKEVPVIDHRYSLHVLMVKESIRNTLDQIREEILSKIELLKESIDKLMNTIKLIPEEQARLAVKQLSHRIQNALRRDDLIISINNIVEEYVQLKERYEEVADQIRRMKKELSSMPEAKELRGEIERINMELNRKAEDYNRLQDYPRILIETTKNISNQLGELIGKLGEYEDLKRKVKVMLDECRIDNVGECIEYFQKLKNLGNNISSKITEGKEQIERLDEEALSITGARLEEAVDFLEKARIMIGKQAKTPSSARKASETLIEAQRIYEDALKEDDPIKILEYSEKIEDYARKALRIIVTPEEENLFNTALQLLEDRRGVPLERLIELVRNAGYRDENIIEGLRRIQEILSILGYELRIQVTHKT